MRGISSSEKAVTHACLAASIVACAAVSGRKEIVIAPFLSERICSGVKGETVATTSAVLNAVLKEAPDKTSAPAVV
jgi:hypothetical protein